MKKPSSQPSSQLGAEGTQPDYVRELLDAGRSDGVSGYDAEAGLARHIAQVQAGAPLPPWAESLIAANAGAAAVAGTTAAKVTTGVATGKLVAGVAIALVTAGAIAALVIGAPENNARVAPAGSAPSVEPLAPPTSGQPGHNTSGDQAAAARETADGTEAVELEIAPITSRSKRTAQGAGAERVHDGESKQTAPRANSKSLEALIEAAAKQGASPTRTSSRGHVDLVAPNAAASRTEPQATSRPSERAEQAATTPTPAPAPVVDDSRLEREMGMLAVAQKVLKSDPERALRLARQGEQEFSGSMFTQERQQVLLLALIELGRISEAKRLALPYLKRYPNGPFSDRLRSALAAAKPEN